MLRASSAYPTVGTITNDNAPAGAVGEYITATLASGSAVALTTAVTANVTSISLTPGDWDVAGIVDYTPGATTSISSWAQGSSTTTAVLGPQDSFSKTALAAEVPTAVSYGEVIPTVRYSLAVTTTIFLVTQAAFTLSTLSAYGTIRARRVR